MTPELKAQPEHVSLECDAALCCSRKNILPDGRLIALCRITDTLPSWQPVLEKVDSG